MGLTQKGAAILQGYTDQAKKSLAHFDEEMSKADGRAFFIITRIHDKKLYEQIYVKVESKKNEVYNGKIASEPMGPIKFQVNALIAVDTKDVVDWLIVSKTGEEEGNLTGKAMDALQAKILVFIIRMQAKQGLFSDFRVVSVRNPKTQQEIREIVPEKMITVVEREAKRRFGKLKSEDGKEKFQSILVSFPDWDLVKE